MTRRRKNPPPAPTPEASGPPPDLPAEPDKPRPPARCELCGRERPLTFHHFVPKAVHGRREFRTLWTETQMQHHGIHICRVCHDGIHIHVPDLRELARSYPSRDALLAHPGIAAHVRYARKRR